MKRFGRLAATLGLTVGLAAPGAAAYAALTFNSSARFDAAVPEPGYSLSDAAVSYCGGPGQALCSGGAEPVQVRWGTGGNGQSRLGYTPAFGTHPFNEAFNIGALKHVNRTINIGSSITAVQLTVATTVTDSGRSISFSDSVPFQLGVDEVLDTTNPCPYNPTQPCADAILLPSGGVQFPARDVGNFRYTLRILGFSTGGSPSTIMISPEGGETTDQLVAVVDKQPLVKADAGPDQMVDEGATATLDGTASQVEGLTYEWEQVSGPAMVLSDPAAARPTFNVPMFTEDQSVEFRLTVRDQVEPDYADSDTVTVRIRDVNDPPTVDPGDAYTGKEGVAVHLDATITDPDGDLPAISWGYTAGGMVDLGATCAFSDINVADPLFTCTDDGSFTVTVTADDGKGGVTTASAPVTLGNLAPKITTVTPSTSDPVPSGTAIGITAPFTDPGANDTHTCTLTWGDGQNSSGVVSGGACTAPHTYIGAGIYTVTVTVTDDDGDSDTAKSGYVVVYDPSAGFVTGGGWINSPAGAYTPTPSLVGRAHFGFVAKYKPGAQTPDGQTEFQFQAGNLNFHSTSYEWLVVAGAKAQYKGAGTLNGAGPYAFLLTARDGDITGNQADAFRLKIWDPATGSVIYDNQIGDLDDGGATTALSGGSIVIHTK